MATQVSMILRQIDVAWSGGTVAGLTDRQLVERFAARRDPTAEVAFAALVGRHGAMVLRVCRNILRDHHDAQDAFQATFLVLARKAGSLWVGDSLGPWLHGVACRVASTSKAAAARRRAHEGAAARPAATFVCEQAADDLCTILHEELARLPDRYRATVVLCDLEGRTYEEAARELGRPVGTIKSRLARGRERLRIRMLNRGAVAPAVALAGVISIESPRAMVSATTIHAIARRATRLVAGHVATNVIPEPVLALTEGVLKTMILSRLKLAATVLLVVSGMLSASAPRVGLISSEAGQPADQAEPAPRDRAGPATHTAIAANGPVSSSFAPDDFEPPAAKPWETAVRIKILHDKSTGFGSGTIIRSTPAESLILTSAHQLKLEKPAALAQIPHRIKVDLFDGRLQESRPAQVHYLETVDGELVDCDFERDISLVRIRPGRRLPASRIVPRQWEPHVQMKMLTVGCSAGCDATAWSTLITNPRFHGLAGNPRYQAIECQTAPKQGRTGGGLFTSDGYLAGTCNLAEPQGDHGLYAAPASIYTLLDRNRNAAREHWQARQRAHDQRLDRNEQQREPRQLRQSEDEPELAQPAGNPQNRRRSRAAFPPSAPAIATREIDDLLRTAELQLNQEEWVGADRTLQHVNALFEERRKELQDGFRSLDASDARREVLLRRASEGRRQTRAGQPRE